MTREDKIELQTIVDRMALLRKHIIQTGKGKTKETNILSWAESILINNILKQER